MAHYPERQAGISDDSAPMHGWYLFRFFALTALLPTDVFGPVGPVGP